MSNFKDLLLLSLTSGASMASLALVGLIAVIDITDLSLLLTWTVMFGFAGMLIGGGMAVVAQ